MQYFNVHFSRFDSQDPISIAIFNTIQEQQQAQLSGEKVAFFCKKFSISPVELALKCLPVAACYSQTPVSKFNVGAIAIGESNTFYFGANQEYSQLAIAQTVHAEQSAVSNAWHNGEKSVTDIIVNYTPCGHCRQFLNELNTCETLKIHLPHSQNNLLHSYLPDSFGPKDLNIESRIFDQKNHNFTFNAKNELEQTALNALNQSHAPYSESYSSVAIELENGKMVAARYGENAAFNPSMMPLQSAMNFILLNFKDDEKSAIKKVLLLEKQSTLSHKNMTESFAKALGAEFEFIQI